METYLQEVADKEHPGGSWGAYVEGIPKRRGITVKDLMAKAGAARGTYYKWTTGSTGVTVDSVMRLAAAAGDPVEVALRAAGGRLVNESDDPQLADIYASDLPDDVKQELVQHVLEERTRTEEALRSQIRIMIKAHERKAS